MDRIKVLDKTFEIFITGEKIEKRIAELSSQMEDDLKGEDIVFLAIEDAAELDCLRSLLRY